MEVLIIGNGITGITAARTIRQLSDHRITVISSETDHFFSRTALMYIYMGHMRYEDTKPYEDWFWEKNRIELKRDWVQSIDTESKRVLCASGEALSYDKLILATGSKPNKFGWPGQDLHGVQGLYSYQDLESLEARSSKINHAVIVGGGLIGIELAEMLHSRHIPVTFLVRESSFWNLVLPLGESEMINRHIREQGGIDLQLSTELKEIKGKDGEVRSVITSSGEEIPCEFVGLTAGVHPNIDMVKNSGIPCERGILVNHSFQTEVPDIYAGGDCAQFKEALPGRKAIEQVWYTGRMHGEIIGKNICSDDGQYEYQPGPWFNSAKFFDIEYQTYGDVPADIGDRDNLSSIFWEDTQSRKAVHLVYESSSGKFTGINSLGIRYRHQLFDLWLREGRDIKYVLENLPAANLDPEFFKQFEQSVIATYNAQNPGQSIQPKAKKGLQSYLKLLGIKA